MGTSATRAILARGDATFIEAVLKFGKRRPNGKMFFEPMTPKENNKYVTKSERNATSEFLKEIRQDLKKLFPLRGIREKSTFFF